jgi:hypothetical protein
MNRMMMGVMVFVALAAFSTNPLVAAGGNSITGIYVEARTAEVFTGGCLMSSEAETTGRQALLAWRINRGTVNGVSLDGLSVVAAVVGDKNLGIHEIGGEKPVSRSALFVDARANSTQRDALVALAKELSSKVMGTVVSVTPAPIQFADKGEEISVAAPQIALAIGKHAEHNPCCGAEQWFHPLATVNDPTIGLTKENSFTGSDLGSKWSDPDKVSAFFGTFTY